MKTYQEWLKTDKNFCDFVEPGNEVDEEMVNYFMNVLPPVNMSFGYLQAGGAYNHVVVDGKWTATYITFAKEDGKWIYKGCCTPGSKENVKNSGDPWAR